MGQINILNGQIAEWRRGGLQIRASRFDSGSDLQLFQLENQPSLVPRVVSHAKNTATATPQAIKTASWRPSILPSVNHRRSIGYRAP